MLSFYFKVLITFISTALISQSAISANITTKQFTDLDMQFKKLSAVFYKNTNYNNANPLSKKTTIESLFSETQQLVNQNKHISAIQLITRHKNLIKNNIDHDSIFFFVNLLIQYNEWNTAYELYQFILFEGDKALVSNIVFIFAKYYISREDWTKTLKLLANITDDLAIEDGFYANIMQGIALQHKKKHRPALKYYKAVPKSSKYYIHAQLNIAIVNIRQGWWSDAQLVMNNIIKNKSNYRNQKTLINRLYLVSGYSFLQQEYFRESRNAFRNIELDSIHTNRALLGISLAAASQGDNIGSLNILNRLQSKKTTDLAVEESYLLLPYVYEKLGQQKTASASYSIALAYYQKRLLELNDLIKNLQQHNLSLNKNSIYVKNNSINFTEKYPVSFLDNYKEIKLFKRHSNDSHLTKKIDVLYKKFELMLFDIVKAFLKQRQSYIESYLNQSRFGLARLYDNSKKLTKK